MSGEKVGQLLKSVRPSITVDIPNIVNFPLFNFSMTARNLGLLASDLEIIQNEPGLTVLHDGYLKILNDVCLNFGKLDKDITELEKNCQEILSKANQLPSNERRPLVYVTYQKVKAFEWSLKIADFFRSKTFWGSVNSRCSSLDNNDETLKRLSELQDYWLEQGEFVTFSSPLIKKVLTTYFPFLENYIKNAEWQLKYHEKLLKAWPIFLENFNQYLKILNNVLNLKKQQLINSLLARIKLVIKEFSLTEESNLVDDDIIHDFYSLFLPHGQLIPDDKKCLKAYPRKHELTVELLEYFIGFILDRGDVEDKQHLEKLFLALPPRGMETRNIACLPFSFQVKHEGKLIPHVTLCPEFLTKSPHFNVERANKLFRGQFSNIIKLMLSIRQIMVMSSDLVKQDISLWSLAELVDVWHKCHRMILEEETRVNDLLGFLKINVNLNIAWLNELFNYKTIIDNYLLEKFEVYLDQVSKLNRYPVDLRICLIALTKLSLSTHTKTSLSPRRSKILQEKRFETRLKGLNLLLDKVKQESLLVALNNFIRLFKMMQFENWQYNDEKFYTKLANNVQINDLKNSIMNYLLSTEQMECLTTILNIMQGKISNLVVNKFVQQWQSLCLSAQLPIYTQTDFILSLSTRFLFTQLYAINTPVYNLIGVLTPDSKQRIEGELQFRTQDALNFLARLFDAASEILIHEEGPECIKISVNDLTISVSLDHIYRYVFSIKQGGQNTQAAWRHILERADAYVKRYKGDNDTYAYLVESLLTEHLTSAYAIKRIDYLYTHQQWKLICEDEWLLWQSKWEPVRSHIQDKFSIFLNQLRNYQNLQLLFWEGGECQFEHQQLYLQLLIVALPRFLTDQQKEELAYLADLEIFETLKLILNKLEKVEPLEKFNLNIMRVLYKELEQQIEKIKCEWPNFPLSKHGRRILNEYFAEIGSIRWRPSAQLLVNAFASPLNIQAYNYKAWSGFLSSKLFADNYKVFLEHHVELMDLSDRYGFPCIREDFASSKPSILKSICSFLDITFEQLKEGNILAVNELALHVVSGYIVELSIIYDYQLALEKYRECIKLLTNLQTEVTRAEKLLKAVANRRYEEAYGIWSDIFNQIVAHSNDEASFQQYIVSSASMLAFNQTLFTQAILAIPQTPTGHTDYGPLQGFSEYLLQQPKIDLSPLLKAFFEEQLFFAAAHGSDVLVILALHCGINVNAQSSNIKTRSFTALHTAAYFGRDRTVKTLLLQGADVKARSYDDESIPLHSAAVSHNSAVIAQLVAAGSPLEACNKNGFSPFTLAVSSGDHEAVETFLQLGVDANIRDSSLQTPFHRVVNRDLLKNPDKIFRIAVILMRYGANCDAQDHTLSTILHLAVKIDKPELDAFIIFLINAGANTTLPDTNNQTPYELASPRLKKIISETTTMFNEETKRRAAALKSEIERIETENNILTQQMETRASRTIVIQELESYELRTAPTPPLAKLVGKLGMISANVPSKTARPALDRLLEAPPEPSPKSKNPIRQ